MQKYNIVLTTDELKIISTCLAEAPFKLVSGVMENLKNQVYEAEKKNSSENVDNLI